LALLYIATARCAESGTVPLSGLGSLSQKPRFASFKARIF